jgi:hypothetical protein
VRPAKTTLEQRETVQRRLLLRRGSVSQVAQAFGISRASVTSISDAAAAQAVA